MYQMPFNHVLLNMPRAKLKLKSFQNSKETFFFKWTENESKTNELKWGEYYLPEKRYS